MLWTPRIISLLFGIILLVPLALIFINMLRYQPTGEEELAEMRSDFEEEAMKQEELRASESGDVHGIVASQHWLTDGVSPFSFTSGTIIYAPRKWVGLVGVASIIALAFCITISALIPRKTLIGSDSWEIRSDSPMSIDKDSNSIIHWEAPKEDSSEQ